MALRIRRGTLDDAEFLAWVMFAASRAHLKRGLWDLIIGADETGCLDYLRRLALAEPRSLYHCESFLIAEIDGERAAALCGFETRGAWEIVGDATSNVQRDLAWTEADRAASYLRVVPIWTACMPPDIGADFAIESVALGTEEIVAAVYAEADFDGVRGGGLGEWHAGEKPGPAGPAALMEDLCAG